MFLTARRFMYQQVYYHRTVRAIDLDLADVFGPSVRAIFGDGSPAERLAAYRRPRRVRAAPPGGALGPRRRHRGDGAGRSAWRRARPGRHRRALAGDPAAPADVARGGEVRAEYEAGELPDALIATLGEAEPGAVAIDLAVVDARPADADAADRLLALEAVTGGRCPLAAALASIPAYWLIGRRYRRR